MRNAFKHAQAQRIEVKSGMTSGIWVCFTRREFLTQSINRQRKIAGHGRDERKPCTASRPSVIASAA